jgi:hypothetical protein
MIKKYLICFTYILLPLAGGGLIGLATSWGAGLSPDSILYISVARNLLAGQGLMVLDANGAMMPLVHYPPLYPAWLALGGGLGFDPLDWARWANLICFGLNIALFARLAKKLIPGDAWPLLLTSLMLLGLPNRLVHAMAWSEPLFLLLGFSGIACLEASQSRRTWPWLGLAALALGLSSLVRYTGLVFIATGVLMVAHRNFFRDRPDWRQPAIFSLMSGLPWLAWTARNYLLFGSFSDRQLYFHPPAASQLLGAAQNVTAWFCLPQFLTVGGAFGFLLFFALALLVGVSTIRRWQNRPAQVFSPDRTFLADTLLLFGIGYALFVLLSLTFFDAHTELDQRILVPLFWVGLLLIGWVLAGLLRKFSNWRWLHLMMAILAGLSLVFYVTDAALWCQRHHAQGNGYASPIWKNSGLIGPIRAIDPTRQIFTNGLDLVYLVSSRQAKSLPARTDPVTQLANPLYARQMNEMRNLLERQAAVIVYFRRISWRWYLPNEQDIMKMMPLVPLVAEKDGGIYFLNSPSPQISQ